MCRHILNKTTKKVTMNLYKYATAALVSFTMFSCVEDEIVFINKGDQILFSRSLASVAVDENPVIEVDITNNSTGEDNSSAYSLNFTSSNPEVIQVNDEGVLTPGPDSFGERAIITVEATLRTLPEEGSTVPIQINAPVGDTIRVGRITLSDSEAIGFSDNADEIILNGFEPRGVINNRISQIDIDSQSTVLSASFFNFKNIDLENPLLTWESSMPSVIEIDENGRLTPVSMGTSTISVSAIVDREEVTAEPLVITVSDQTVVEEQPEPENNVTVIGFGTFQSNSFYTPEGTFQIVEENGETRINLADNFNSGGNVPDLVLYLSNQTNTNTGAQFISEDIDAEGAQSFVIPADVDVSRYANVLIYCRRFSQRVGFGVINR